MIFKYFWLLKNHITYLQN